MNDSVFCLFLPLRSLAPGYDLGKINESYLSFYKSGHPPPMEDVHSQTTIYNKITKIVRAL